MNSPGEIVFVKENEFFLAYFHQCLSLWTTQKRHLYAILNRHKHTLVLYHMKKEVDNDYDIVVSVMCPHEWKNDFDDFIYWKHELRWMFLKIIEITMETWNALTKGQIILESGSRPFKGSSIFNKALKWDDIFFSHEWKLTNVLK